LLEFKLCQTFATPYLVFTFNSDLASMHDLVFMRGEITSSVTTKSTTGDYLLSQHDARLLAQGLQRFYLWGRAGKGRRFERFSLDLKREELLKNADLGAWMVSHVDSLPFITFIFCL